MSHSLNAEDTITKLIKAKGIATWTELIAYIQNIPYGRNANRTDLSLVIIENKGTCSSKHALLKEIANRNEIPNIRLIIGLYKMNQQNTPKIGTVLLENNLDFIPEAHCYLKTENHYLDITSKESQFEKLKNVILEEIEIEPSQVNDFKIAYHQAFIKKWIIENNISFTFEELWEIREKCIFNLSQNQN